MDQHELVLVLHEASKHQLQRVDRRMLDHECLVSLAEEQAQFVESLVDLAIGRNQLVLQNFDHVVAVESDNNL